MCESSPGGCVRDGETDPSDSGPFPRPLQWVPYWWTTFCLRGLDAEQLTHLHSLRPEITLTLGNDATGANGPWWALKGMASGLQLEGASVNVDLRFSSEHPGKEGGAPRLFNKLNCPPA
eukprot:8364997-Alexandrium_andersonii.AAC.1